MNIPIAGVSATPDPSALPGSNVLQQIVNGADAWALAITLLGTFIGAGPGLVNFFAHLGASAK